MPSWPTSLETLIEALGKLPGVGRRSAERMALALVRNHRGIADLLGEALDAARRELRLCRQCGGVTTTDADPCEICTSTSRDAALLCVVEQPEDIAILERTGTFEGRYHALMGKISPMKGSGPGNVRVQSLMQRVESEGTREVVLALGTDVEGDATASYLAELLQRKGVRVTRPAYGLPVGSGIAYADEVTLRRALNGRSEA